MGYARDLKIAYSLLPPPISSTPAKYWTSISLLLHSYAVGRAFEIFVEVYGKRYEDVPESQDAFLIGFIHDMGQKLKVRGRSSVEKLRSWFEERLQNYYSNGEAATFTDFLFTNPAETGKDPLYPARFWTLLQLADEIQGTNNPIEIYSILQGKKDKLGIDLYVKIINISIPQPFIRSMISMNLYNKLQRDYLESESSPDIVIPISTPYGAILITDNPNIEIDFDWDEFVRMRPDGSSLLPNNLESLLEDCDKCCNDKQCREKCGNKKDRDRPSDCPKKFTKKDCEQGSYEKILQYFSYNSSESSGTGYKIILSSDLKGMFQGVKLSKDIEFKEGKNICPICGLKVPVGFRPAILSTFASLKAEQWSRKYKPGNLNIYTQNTKPYAVDPLCLGDAIIRTSNFTTETVLSIYIGAPVLSPVIYEVSNVAWYLLSEYMLLINKKTMADRLHSLFYHDDWEKDLSEMVSKISNVKGNYIFDIFGNHIILPLPYNRPRRHQDEWLYDISVAGILASWGFYPLEISPTPSFTYSNTLLRYFKGRRYLYDYPPSDMNAGVYTSYVASAMASLVESEDFDILDYPPRVAPALVQYSSPALYSQIENFMVKFSG
ncbi:MAG TPA: hypothetical protein ENO36_03600 [Fervidicoccus fontis]|uniref:Uncharacterized protein n=1 Tax=Fervidicoccus fontis TaxID=683846 RepID=A0A7C2Z484_9CREN|nr:hypothetical protein [Fervidicoccus fontis]